MDLGVQAPASMAVTIGTHSSLFSDSASTDICEYMLGSNISAVKRALCL